MIPRPIMLSRMINRLHQGIRTLVVRWIHARNARFTSRVHLAEGDKESEAGTGMCVRCGHS